MSLRTLRWWELGHTPHIDRDCSLNDCGGWHAWEWLNAGTLDPFKRGRVVFFCKKRGPAVASPGDCRARPSVTTALRSAELVGTVTAVLTNHGTPTHLL